MPITQKERKYLKNKHKGGKNNSKGAIYESYYATYMIASFMGQYITNLSNISLSSQLKNTFVDDLLIEESNAHKIYHQLKDVEKLAWRTGKHSLERDFSRQMEISQERKEDFELKLIYSNPNSAVSVIPDEIISCTSSMYFPSCLSINQLILSYPPFKEAIQNITVQCQAEDDELSGIASAILGAWNSVEQKDVTLKQISDIVRLKGKGYVNLKDYPTITVSDKCRDILGRFGIAFYENGPTLYWSRGHLKGEVLWTSEIEQNLQVANPVDFWDLIEILS